MRKGVLVTEFLEDWGNAHVKWRDMGFALGTERPEGAPEATAQQWLQKLGSPFWWERLLSCHWKITTPPRFSDSSLVFYIKHQNILEMPTSWQPNYISQITSQSWKKHQKLGQDHTSLFSVVDNEATADRWLSSTESSSRKGCGERSGSKQVTARLQTP